MSYKKFDLYNEF